MSKPQTTPQSESKELEKVSTTTAGQKVTLGLKHCLVYMLILVVSTVVGFFGTWAVSRLKIKYRQWTVSTTQESQ